MVGRMSQLAFEDKPLIHNILNNVEFLRVMEEEIAVLKVFQYRGKYLSFILHQAGTPFSINLIQK
jgi:hypothetical protein